MENRKINTNLPWWFIGGLIAILMIAVLFIFDKI